MTLADVLDAEGFVAQTLRKVIRSSRTDYGDIRSVDLEERSAALMAELWSCYLRWNPDSGVRFRAYASFILRGRAIDFDRKRRGRHGQKLQANAVSLDALTDERGEWDRVTEHHALGSDRARLGDALNERVVDGDVHSLAGFRRAVAQRSGELALFEAGLRADRSLDQRTVTGAS